MPCPITYPIILTTTRTPQPAPAPARTGASAGRAGRSPMPDPAAAARRGASLRPGWLLALWMSWLPAASAHVVLDRPQAPAGSYYKAVLRVPHGCNGAPTIGLRVRIPEGVVAVKPQPKPGWTLVTERAPLTEPYESHGRRLADGVREVRWSGGELPDEQFDEFAILMKLPAGAGRTLAFATVQDCAGGAVERWVELPAAGPGAPEPARPAPLLRLTEPAP